ncbi:YceI family protein [Wenyingzhuangia sp. IMCC45574]
MKKILFTLLCLSTLLANAQLYKTDKANIRFDAAKTAIEPIKAENKKAKLILNEKTGEIACLIQIAQFEFPNKLMQEHFNENYLESDTYPKATLAGKITNFTSTDFSTAKEVKVVGDFTIHGKKQNKTVPVTIVKKGDTYTINGSFKLILKDYKVKIPKLMFYKIAEDVEVTLNAELKKS